MTGSDPRVVAYVTQKEFGFGRDPKRKRTVIPSSTAYYQRRQNRILWDHHPATGGILFAIDADGNLVEATPEQRAWMAQRESLIALANGPARRRAAIGCEVVVAAFHGNVAGNWSSPSPKSPTV